MADSRSDFDIILDKPWVDFFQELDRIKSGQKMIQDSPLYQFAKQSDKERMNDADTPLEESTAIIKHVYQSANASSVFDDLPINNNIKFYFKNCLEISSAKANRAWHDLEYCVTDSGTHSDFNTVIQLIWKRFHKRFGIRDFLLCQIYADRTSLSSSSPGGSFPELYSQFVASRLNYVLNGNYLPILGGISSQTHHTSFIIFPSDEDSPSSSSSSSSSQSTNWCFVHINSNGDPENLNYVDLLYDAFDQYKLFLSNQEDNMITSSTSMCWEDIQQQYGTCGNWGIILTFVLFRHICDVGTGFMENIGVDQIQRICQKIEKKMTNPISMQRMNDLITDMKLSVQYLIVDTFEKLEDANHHVDISITDVYQAVLHGQLMDGAIVLEKQIFQIMCNVHKYVYKNMNEVPATIIHQHQFDYETDDETPEEIKRKNWIGEFHDFENMERPAEELQILNSLNHFRKRFASGSEITSIDLNEIYLMVEKLQILPPDAMFKTIVRRFFIYLYTSRWEEIIEKVVSVKNRLRELEKEISTLQDKVDEEGHEEGGHEVRDAVRDKERHEVRVAVRDKERHEVRDKERHEVRDKERHEVRHEGDGNDTSDDDRNEMKQPTIDLLIKLMKERDDVDQKFAKYNRKLFQLDASHLDSDIEKFCLFISKIQKLHEVNKLSELSRSSIKRKTYDLT